MASSHEERHAALIDRISKLQWTEMAKASEAAIEDEKKLIDTEALGVLGRAFFSMLIGEQKCINSAIAQLRTRDFDLRPDTFVFELFRNKRLAETFKEHPHMVEVMKARAKAEAYNVGVKAMLNLFDKIAGDPDHYINKVATAIDEEKQTSIMPDPENDGTLEETIEAMGNYLDYFNAGICSSYFQYKLVPTKYDCVVREGRVTRKRSGVNYSTEPSKVNPSNSKRVPKAKTPQNASRSSRTPRAPRAPRKTKGQHVREDSPSSEAVKSATIKTTRQEAQSSIESIALKPATARPSSESGATASKVLKHNKTKVSRSI